MATHSSILAQEIPCVKEPGGLQSMGSQKSQTWLSDWTTTFHIRNMPPFFIHSSGYFIISSFGTFGNKIGVCVLVAQSCLTLCNPTDSSPPGSPVPGILQARTLEWVTISFSKRNYRKKESEVTELSPTLCDPMDFSLPGSSIMDSSRQEYWSGSSFPSPKLVWIFFFLKKMQFSRAVQ